MMSETNLSGQESMALSALSYTEPRAAVELNLPDLSQKRAVELIRMLESYGLIRCVGNWKERRGKRKYQSNQRALFDGQTEEKASS